MTWGHRARRRSASRRAVATSGEAVTRLTMPSAGRSPFAEHQESQEALLGLLPVHAPAPLAHERPHLGQHGVHAVGLEETALDVQDRVVPLRLVEAHDRLPVHLGERELHLVAIAVDLGGADDRGHRDVGEPAEARQALDDLALLELELGLVAGRAGAGTRHSVPKYGHGGSVRKVEGCSSRSIVPRAKRGRTCVNRTSARSPGTPPGTNTT